MVESNAFNNIELLSSTDDVIDSEFGLRILDIRSRPHHKHVLFQLFLIDGNTLAQRLACSTLFLNISKFGIPYS